MLNFWLMAALLCGMSLGVASCKDDDNDNGGADNEIPAGELSEEDVQAWSWVSTLTDETEPTDGWQKSSFDVTVGQQSDNDPMARLVFANDLEGAKANFASLSGCDPEELNGTKTVSVGKYGSMTWNISEPGAPNIATVELNSTLFRKTNRIIYCTEEQAPENAAEITGNCYYRLGDVVEDKDGYYWVCVQPSFKGKKYQDSRWVNIFNAAASGKGVNTGKNPGIPKSNIYSKCNKIEKYNNNIILLPTGLKQDRQSNYYLSNLLWLLIEPTKYDTYLSGKSDIGMADLPKKYHGKKFLEMLGRGWAEKEIYQKLFNCSESQMKDFAALKFFYNGYHWKAGTTAGVWIYTSEDYESKYKGKLSNDDILFEMKKKGYGFDVRRYASDPNADKNCASTGEKDMAPANQFDGDAGYWVIRVAKGSQLDKKYTPYKAMTNMKDVYNFNEYNVFSVGAKELPPTDEQLKGTATDVSADPVYTKRGYYDVGDVVRDAYGRRWFCVQPSPVFSAYNSDYPHYAYFVSYDAGSVYDDDNQPSSELQAQMLFAMHSLYRPASYVIPAAADESADRSRRVGHITTYGGVNLFEIFGQREADNPNVSYQYPCDFASTFYISQDNHDNVLRFIYDYTPKTNSTELQKLYSFWTVYSADNSKEMTFNDLSSADAVKKYADDKWVSHRWHDYTNSHDVPYSTNMGKLTPADIEKHDISWYMFDIKSDRKYYYGTGPMNMYREPLYLFAVKRVYDEGKRQENFEDGTKFREHRMMKTVAKDLATDVPFTYSLNCYKDYQDARDNNWILLNGRQYEDFSLSNVPAKRK